MLQCMQLTLMQSLCSGVGPVRLMESLQCVWERQGEPHKYYGMISWYRYLV
jgi:hypothetical protein